MSQEQATTPPVPTSDDDVHEVWDENELGKSSAWQRFRVPVLRLALLVVVLGAWQTVSGTLIDPFFVSDPVHVVQSLGRWVIEGTLVQALLFTMYAMLIGFVIGAVAGIVCGLVLGRSKTIAKVVDPFILAVYSLPKVALVPLFLLWFGIGLKTNTAVSALTVFFLVFYNTYSGARTVDKDLVDVVRLMGGSRRDVFQCVVIPSTTVWIFTGLRLAIPYALIGAIVGEIVASDRGLGYLLREAAGYYDTGGVFAALIVLMLISSGLNYLVNRLERRASRWRMLPE